MKRVNKNNYKATDGHKPIGVTKTVPRLSLSVSELVKRFTLTTLKEMEAKSLLNYDFEISPDASKEEQLALLDKLDLTCASCIDLTDLDALNREAKRQMKEYQKLAKKQAEENEKKRLEDEAAKKQALIDEAKKQLMAEQNELK